MADILPIKADNISAYYRRTNVFSALSFEIGPRCIYFLTGENGSGKTTLIRTISTLRRLQSGELIFGRERLDYQATQLSRLRARIAVLQDRSALYPELTGTEHLDMWMTLRKGTPHIDASKLWREIPLCQDWLASGPLSNRLDDPVSNYSAGMRQQLLLSDIFAQTHANVALLDEAQNTLDADAKERLANSIAHWCEQHRAVVIATHDREGWVSRLSEVLNANQMRDIVLTKASTVAKEAG